MKLKKYRKGGEIDPPKGPFIPDSLMNLNNKDLAMFLRKLITDKIPLSQIGSPVSSSMNFLGVADDDEYTNLTMDTKRSHYNDDGSATFDFGAYQGAENSLGFNFFGVPVKKDKYGMEYIDPITIHPFEETLALKRKSGSNLKPLKPVDPFPNVYGRKMDASGTKAVYNTDKGDIVKNKGKEDADFIRLMMRLGRNYR